MGQLLSVLGDSRCGFQPPDLSVPKPELFLGEGKDPLVASGYSNLNPRLGENALAMTPELHLITQAFRIRNFLTTGKKPPGMVYSRSPGTSGPWSALPIPTFPYCGL